jgi:hypothetical protein
MPKNDLLQFRTCPSQVAGELRRVFGALEEGEPETAGVSILALESRQID